MKADKDMESILISNLQHNISLQTTIQDFESEVVHHTSTEALHLYQQRRGLQKNFIISPFNKSCLLAYMRAITSFRLCPFAYVLEWQEKRSNVYKMENCQQEKVSRWKTTKLVWARWMLSLPMTKKRIIMLIVLLKIIKWHE